MGMVQLAYKAKDLLVARLMWQGMVSARTGAQNFGTLVICGRVVKLFTPAAALETTAWKIRGEEHILSVSHSETWMMGRQ